MCLGMPFDVRPDIVTDRDHPQAAPPGVVEREPGQLGGKAAALVAGQHLGVDQRDAIPLHDVVEEAGELVTVARLVALRGLRIDESRFHAVDGTWMARPEGFEPPTY